MTAAVLASHNNSVVGVDADNGRIDSLRSGRIPIHEPNLSERIMAAGYNLVFTNDYASLNGCDAVFLCVPTPNQNGMIDLSYVISAARGVRDVTSSSVLVIKSTVLPGTARKIASITGMTVVSNPEFTREGSAVHDTEEPDRIVIGGDSTDIVAKIWEFTHAPMVITTNENAELIKYASNAFLAVKISFINQIADLCEKIPGTDVNVIADGMGLDRRIGREFLRAGLGYGGSCFPKDTVALSGFALEKGVSLSIVDSAVEYNNRRIDDLVEKMKARAGSLNGKRICVLGLSFKDNTDDLRESRSIRLINRLKYEGAAVRAYDPVVRSVGNVNVCIDLNECISWSEIVVTATEWGSFSSIDPSDLRGKIIFDLRRVFDPGKVEITMGVGIGKN